MDVTLPYGWYNLGIDFYLNSAFRIGGGVLFKSDDPSITGTFADAENTRPVASGCRWASAPLFSALFPYR